MCRDCALETSHDTWLIGFRSISVPLVCIRYDWAMQVAAAAAACLTWCITHDPEFKNGSISCTCELPAAR